MWTKSQIVDLLDRNPLAVARALLVLLARQTADERAAHNTEHRNGMGFNSADARYCTWLAKEVQKWYDTPVERRQYKMPFGPKHLEKARAKLYKYAGQLADAANARAA